MRTGAVRKGGVAAAVRLGLDKVGWRVVSATVVLDSSGNRIDLARYSPKFLQAVFAADFLRARRRAAEA